MHAVFRTTALAVTLVMAPQISYAQANHAAHATSPQASVATAPNAALADGEVRAVDRAAGSVVIKHGPLTSLNMGPMTMEFVARDPALLAKVKVGDRVRFTPAVAKDGTLLVTSLVVVSN
jgi:Cu(I)/Ag(I) efflux system periplasmic protein CusF